MDIVGIDHPYCRHWSESYKTNCSHVMPIQWVLPACKRNTPIIVPHQFTLSDATNLSSDGSEDEIDVESLDEVMSPYTPGRTYDVQRARVCMEEAERFADQTFSCNKFLGTGPRTEEDLEATTLMSSWSVPQTKLYSKVLKVLKDEKLARTTFKGVNNEPIARRLSLDRAASLLRRIFAEFCWDQKLTQWLHTLLMSKLSAGLLACYLDLLQTLRSKVPALLERIIIQSSSESSAMGLSSLNILLKSPWQPSLVNYPFALHQVLYEKPIILIVPSSPHASSPSMAHRKRFWNTYLSQLGTVVSILSPQEKPGMTLLLYIELLASAVVSKIQSIRYKFPKRPIVLLGWHTASILCCHISLVEKVSAVVCLGFPMKTLNGPRGTVDDILCDMTTPALFITGDEADSCSINRLEDFREQLLTKCQNFMIGIPGADDCLRVNEKVKRKASVTQHMVDRMALDYVSNFFSNVLPDGGGSLRMSGCIQSNKQKCSGLRRRRQASSDGTELSLVKRRRISASTSTLIAEVLSNHSNIESGRVIIQGISYNLRTGNLNGMVTVPNVFRRSSCKPSDQSSLKSKNKSQQRSITIDLAKNMESQLKSRKSVVSFDSTLLASGSQTEAAVATILDINFSSIENFSSQGLISTQSRELQNQKRSKFCGESATGSYSTPPNAITEASELSRLTASNQVSPRKSKAAYTNVKFKSTVMSKSNYLSSGHEDLNRFSTINKKGFPGILKPMLKPTLTPVSHFPRQYPYISPAVTQAATCISSRSQKDERETMQATAVLEKLASGINNNIDLTDLSRSSQGDHSRIQTRGSNSSDLSRKVLMRRQKSLTNERIMSSRFKNASTSTLPKYILSSGVHTLFSNSMVKIVSAASQQESLLTASSKPSSQIIAKAPSKPSILPVYAFTPTQKSSNIKIQDIASQEAAVGSYPVTPIGYATEVTCKKKPKVAIRQRLPVKFSGAIPGSSYSFVTLPALTEPLLSITSQKLPNINEKKMSDNQSKFTKEPKKYSVSPHSSTQTCNIRGKEKTHQVSSAMQNKASSSTKTAAFAVPMKDPPIPTSTTASLFTSPSVVLHKLWNNTVAEFECVDDGTEEKQLGE